MLGRKTIGPMRTLNRSAAISRRAALGVLMTAASAGRHAAALPALKADELVQFRVELPVDLHELAGRVRVAKVAVATPAAFDRAQPWRVLIVNATSDPGFQSSRDLMMAYRSAAVGAGWVALAAVPDTEIWDPTRTAREKPNTDSNLLPLEMSLRVMISTILSVLL